MYIDKEDLKDFISISEKKIENRCYLELVKLCNKLSINEYGKQTYEIRNNRRLRYLSKEKPTTWQEYCAKCTKKNTKTIHPFDMIIFNFLREYDV